MLSCHAAYTLRGKLGINANGCDKERIPGSATKNPYGAGARLNILKRSLGDPNYWRASTQCLIQMSPKTRTLMKVQVVDHQATGDVFERLMGKDPKARFTFIKERAEFADLDI